MDLASNRAEREREREASEAPSGRWALIDVRGLPICPPSRDGAEIAPCTLPPARYKPTSISHMSALYVWGGNRSARETMHATICRRQNHLIEDAGFSEWLAVRYPAYRLSSGAQCEGPAWYTFKQRERKWTRQWLLVIGSGQWQKHGRKK